MTPQRIRSVYIALEAASTDPAAPADTLSADFIKLAKQYGANWAITAEEIREVLNMTVAQVHGTWIAIDQEAGR